VQLQGFKIENLPNTKPLILKIEKEHLNFKKIIAKIKLTKT